MKNIAFTRREIEILHGIRNGLTTKAIAERLFISQQTVHRHLRNLCGKVGVRNALQLLFFVFIHPGDIPATTAFRTASAASSACSPTARPRKNPPDGCTSAATPCARTGRTSWPNLT